MGKSLLHLVFGGEVKNTQGIDFAHLDDLDMVGVYPNYDEALNAWRGASQARVDEANVKYVIVHLHRLMEPEDGNGEG